MGLSVCTATAMSPKYGSKRAAAGRHHPVGGGRPVPARHRGAGRFIEKTGGRGGYMAIFSSRSRPTRQASNATACAPTNVITHASIARAAASGDCPRRLHRIQPYRRSDECPGSYPPAGPIAEIDPQDVTQALTGVESRAPTRTAGGHWGNHHRHSQARMRTWKPCLKLSQCDFRFVKGESEIMRGHC